MIGVCIAGKHEQPQQQLCCGLGFKVCDQLLTSRLCDRKAFGTTCVYMQGTTVPDFAGCQYDSVYFFPMAATV